MYLLCISGEKPQRIGAEIFGQRLNLFGSSIFGRVNVDDFAQGDLAIGAPGKASDSGNVVILKTRDIVFLTPTTEEPEIVPPFALLLTDKGKFW